MIPRFALLWRLCEQDVHTSHEAMKIISQICSIGIIIWGEVLWWCQSLKFICALTNLWHEHIYAPAPKSPYRTRSYFVRKLLILAKWNTPNTHTTSYTTATLTRTRFDFFKSHTKSMHVVVVSPTRSTLFHSLHTWRQVAALPHEEPTAIRVFRCHLLPNPYPFPPILWFSRKRWLFAIHLEIWALSD